MWNKRKEDEMPPRAAGHPSGPATTATNVPPPPTSTGRSYEAPSLEPRGGSAMIGKSVMIKGQIISREDLTIDGDMEGTVELQEHRLTIGPNGKIQAALKAREIVVLGTIHGNVEASEKIDIRKDARLVGDIKTARIVIEDGAYFKGSIDITKSAEPKQHPAAPKAAPAAAPAPAPASTPAQSAAPAPAVTSANAK